MITQGSEHISNITTFNDPSTLFPARHCTKTGFAVESDKGIMVIYSNTRCGDCAGIHIVLTYNGSAEIFSIVCGLKRKTQ